MKISLNWIKEFVNLDGIDIKELLNQFTISVAEIEGVEEVGNQLSGVVTAKIVSVENHPNSKKLHVLKVDIGNENYIDVVCGAPNVRVGMVVPFATMGANVNGFKIGKAVLGGVESYGMCCSGKELGVSDDDDGLWELSPDLPLGKDIVELFSIKDIIFEIDNKSITNRPDLWGHYGIAREIAALTKRPLKPLQVVDTTIYNNLPKLNINVESDSCLRYSGITIDNITKKVSPETMQVRLYYVGMRAINLLTDLTNYLMLELGQPMHAFDNQKVKSINVFNLKENVNFLTLDGVERELKVGTMVIAQNQTPVAVAGIMGGELSGISNETTSVLLESANFDATTIRKTSTALGLRSESSNRYEKTLDPEMTTLAINRYLYLLQQHDQGVKVTSSLTDIYKKKYEPVTIEITKEYIDKYIGINIEEDVILDILNRLEFKIEKNNSTYKILVPTFRATKDVKLPCDIVEEIARLYGYNNITPKGTTIAVKPVELNKEVEYEYLTKYTLATKFNLNEVHTYIWYDTQTNKNLGINPKSIVKLVNALNVENSSLRHSIIPSLLKVVEDNKNSFDEIGVFEIGRTAKEFDQNNLVVEGKNLGIVRYSKTNKDVGLLIEVKNMIEYIIAYLFNYDVKVMPKQNTLEYYNPVNNYEFFANGESVGEIALLHPQVKNNIYKNCSVVIAELDFEKLVNLSSKQIKYSKVSKYPGSEFDYSFVVPKDMLYSQIYQIATNIKTDLNFSVSYVDVFEQAENKVITINVKVWANDHTLSPEELDGFYDLIIKEFEKHNIFIKL